MHEDWLDAFEVDDIDAAELAKLDAAVERLVAARAEVGVVDDPLARSAVPLPADEPSRSRWRTVVGLGVGFGGLSLAAAIAAQLLIGAMPASVQETAPGVPRSPERQTQRIEEVTEPIEAPVGPEVPSVPAESAVASGPEQPKDSGVSVEPERAATLQIVAVKKPGLFLQGEATLSVSDDAATLAQGVAHYVRDAEHDPGVGAVRWANLPLVAVPVGTEFTIAAQGELGAIVVQHGSVRLEHTDGRTLALMQPGDEMVVRGDAASPLGLRVMAIQGQPLDQISKEPGWGEMAPVIGLVARIRLASLEQSRAAALPYTIPERP